MKEHTHLVAEHDVWVALCLAENGHYINWMNNLPDEVLYVPEEVFDQCAPRFLQLLGDRYYERTGLSPDLLEALTQDLGRTTDEAQDLTVKNAAEYMLAFLINGVQKSKTHYLAFEGP
ncbi:MAG: hypothetical protein WD627_12090 [Actinomycetota bacterium]